MTGRPPDGMDDTSRRRVIAALGGTVGATALAGCSGGLLPGDDGTPTSTPAPTATEARTNPSVTGEGRIDYPGMIDGNAAVNTDGDTYVVEYLDPSRRFQLVSGFEGERDPSQLRVTRDMTVDARAGFVAPIYDGGNGEFVYQAFANEAFVEYADWRFVTTGADDGITGQGRAPFERIQGSVYAAGVTPGDVNRVFVVDRTAETLRETGGEDLSGIVVIVGEPQDEG